jgi:4-amino-4-deoxy-L-arabinose transferase-like glycosyltransferase
MEKVKTILNSKRKLLLLFIILFSAFFRLYRIDGYMEFLGDQARDLLVVSDFLKKGDLFFIGPQTSIGNMYLPPFYYYLIAPSLLLFNFSPLGPAVFVALLGVLTVYLVFFVTKEFFNSSAGLVAAFLYAVSPSIIRFSNFSWNPNVMPLFSLLLLYSLYQIWQKKAYRFLPLLSLSFIMCLNSHYLSLLFLPLIFIFLTLTYFKYRPNLKKDKLLFKNLFWSILLFLFSLFPLVLFDFKHRGQNLKAVVEFFTVRQTTVNLKAYKAVPNLWPIFVQIITDLPGAKLAIPGLLFSIFILLAMLLIFLRKKKKILPGFILLSSWFFIVLLGLGLYKQHIYTHYFGLIFPIPYMLIAYFLILLTPKKGKQFYYPILISITIVLSLPSFTNSHLLYPPNQQLKVAQTVAQTIIDQSNQEPFNLALLAKSNYDDTYEYPLKLKNAPLYTIHEKLTDQLFVICEPHPDINCDPYNNPAWEIASFGWAQEVGQWSVGDITITKLVHDQK